jgi:hypothetical protein
VKKIWRDIMEEEKKFLRIRDWAEPAHPNVINLKDELVSIYKFIREKYQADIDKAFDKVSRQIGFVVTTTLPVVLEVDKGRKVKSISMGAEHLKGTIFEKEMSAVLKPLHDEHLPAGTAGTYNLNLLWFDALKLKLRTDWMEPAHYLTEISAESIRPQVAAKSVATNIYSWREPAHWFDPRIKIPIEEAVLIEAIDEVYPELKLTERVASTRENLRKIRPEVKEPAHYYRQVESGSESEEIKKALSELATVLRRYGY